MIEVGQKYRVIGSGKIGRITHINELNRVNIKWEESKQGVLSESSYSMKYFKELLKLNIIEKFIDLKSKDPNYLFKGTVR